MSCGWIAWRRAGLRCHVGSWLPGGDERLGSVLYACRWSCDSSLCSWWHAAGSIVASVGALYVWGRRAGYPCARGVCCLVEFWRTMCGRSMLLALFLVALAGVVMLAWWLSCEENPCRCAAEPMCPVAVWLAVVGGGCELSG
jgi:hypothetical protein